MKIMGDFSAIMDRQLDKSNIGSAIPEVFRNCLTDNGLIDIWQTEHARVRD